MIKFFISFAISFLILAFPISGKPVFYYLFRITAPMTEGIYEGIRNGAKASLEKGQEVGWSFFTNALPPEKKETTKAVTKPQAKVDLEKIEEHHHEKDNAQLEELIKK